jgi:hypothetical protein
MDLKELFFKKLQEKCEKDFKQYVYDVGNCQGKGKYYCDWYYFDDNFHELKTYDYETFVEKFFDELLHCHGEVTFNIHSKFG